MGPRYQTIASYLREGPAWLKVNLGAASGVALPITSISPPSNAPENAPFSSFYLRGPNGSLAYLHEEEISHIQPDGPQDGVSLHITLDNGISLTLSRNNNPVPQGPF